MGDVHRVEPGQGHPQPHIGLGERVTEQVTPGGQPLVQVIQGGEQAGHRAVVGLLRGGEPAPVHAVVDGGVDPLVERVDLRPQRGGVEVERRAGPAAELRAQVDGEVGEVVADDPAGLLVPQHRHRDVPVVAGFGRLVGLPEQGEAVDRIWRVAGAVPEGPAAPVPDRVDHRHRHHVLQAQQRPDDGRAVRPRAGERDVQVVAAGLSGVAGGPVRAHPALERVHAGGRRRRPPGAGLSRW